MSVDEEKKTFVIKHTFTDVKNMKNGVHLFGNEEKHFKIPWSISIYLTQSSSIIYVSLSCRKFRGEEDWSVETVIDAKFATKTGEQSKNQIYPIKSGSGWFLEKELLKDYLVDGNLAVEFHVTINKTTGIEYPILRNFNDESAKELSDVVLKVNNRKFYVLKKYLASHSTYFKSLFLGNFEESKRSEIELKDIDPWDFQKFLEALHGELIATEDNIEEILQLADMYDAKTVIRQCEDFLIFKSEKDLKFKFNVATKYNMDQLKKKCISELKTVEDIEKIIPKENDFLDKETLRHFLDLAFEFHKK